MSTRPLTAETQAAEKKSVLSVFEAFRENCATRVKTLSDEVSTTRNDINSIERRIDTLVSTPETLANKVLGTIRSVGRTGEAVIDKIRGYADTLSAISQAEPPESNAEASTLVLQTAALVNGLAQSVTQGNIKSRFEAVKAARDLAAAALVAKQIAEAAETALPDYTTPSGANAPGYVAPSEVLEAMTRIAARAQAILLERAFSLRVERVVTLERDSCVLDLVWQFYGSTADEIVEEFIDQNHLVDSEILVIPSGMEVRYYVG